MRGPSTLAHFLALTLALPAVAATTPSSNGDDGHYESIATRNVFGLNPPQTNAGPPPEAPPPPLKITLTGITTMLGNKRALLTVQVTNGPAESHILAEGQGAGKVEVVQIDEIAGTVKVRNHGVDQVLDFKTDGAKPQAPPPATPPLLAPGKPPATAPGTASLVPPPALPTATTQESNPPPLSTPGTPSRIYPTRSTRMPQTPAPEDPRQR